MPNEIEVITSYLRTAYDDEHLAMLRAHCEDGKLVHMSCCCFAGIASAPAGHALRIFEPGEWVHDYTDTVGGEAASYAFNMLALNAAVGENRDELRRRRLLPLIIAEQDRRERERVKDCDLNLVCEYAD